MSKIEIMNENLANKIAAGEVVEKCMNVVKELVENAIDAGSKTIKIDLIDSGVKEITITDDGAGMDKDDAILAFSRHATSKLKTEEDLFYINSLGFRGEALPSIASVSNIVLKTSDSVTGTCIKINGGKIENIKSSDLKRGTRITVSDLFYNTPVRLKYLKNLYTELALIVDYVNKMALSYPNIRFILRNNGKELLNTDGSGNLLKVIGNIYGIELTKKMIPINASNDDYEISGYISYPELSKTYKNNITTLVNGRNIKNYDLNKVILDSYHTYIPDGKYPIIVLNIETDPILIDVNVHPTKMDIKFSKMDTLRDLIVNNIREKLETINLIPEVNHQENLEEQVIITDIDYPSSMENEVSETVCTNIEETRFDFSVSDTNEDYVDTNRIKKMYPVGVVHATYIIAENEDGMYMIDQHAAAERINYEKYLEKLGLHDNSVIDLLIPIKIELSNADYIILKENFNVLTRMGFTIEEFGINTIMVRSHPYWLPENIVDEAIRKIVDIVIRTEDFDSYKFTERVATTLACKMSIKANDYITITDMEDLLERLRNTKNPFTCPHGRPTIIFYSKYELERLFKRVMN